jgi:hypothetical protein
MKEAMPKTINKLYGGKYHIEFDPYKHKYTLDGQVIKSVTGVLNVIAKPMLVPWAAKVTTEKINELFKPGVSYDEIQIKDMLTLAKRAHYDTKTSAGDIGSLVHKWIEQYINGNNPGELVHEEANKSAAKFVKWAQDRKVEFLLSEQMVFSPEYMFCGTFDFICRIDGKLYIGDIKTSNALHKVEMGAQLAAYKLARSEEFKDELYYGAVLVRVGKNQEEDLEVWEVEDLDPYEYIFLEALELGNAIDKVATL